MNYTRIITTFTDLNVKIRKPYCTSTFIVRDMRPHPPCISCRYPDVHTSGFQKQLYEKSYHNHHLYCYKCQSIPTLLHFHYLSTSHYQQQKCIQQIIIIIINNKKYFWIFFSVFIIIIINFLNKLHNYIFIIIYYYWISSSLVNH